MRNILEKRMLVDVDLIRWSDYSIGIIKENTDRDIDFLTRKRHTKLDTGVLLASWGVTKRSFSPIGHRLNPKFWEYTTTKIKKSKWLRERNLRKISYKAMSSIHIDDDWETIVRKRRANKTYCMHMHGVCDNYQQILKMYDFILNDPNEKFFISLTRVRRDQETKGGWRWEKWGTYIGKQKPTTEYIVDEPLIEEVFCYTIYRLEDAPPYHVSNRFIYTFEKDNYGLLFDTNKHQIGEMFWNKETCTFKLCCGSMATLLSTENINSRDEIVNFIETNLDY